MQAENPGNASAPFIYLPFLGDHRSVLSVVLCVKIVASYTWSNFPVVFIGRNSNLTHSVMTQSEILPGICFRDIWPLYITKLTVLIEDNVWNLF